MNNELLTVADILHFYNENVRWHKLGTKPELWGTRQHIEGCFRMVDEEMKELVKGYSENNPVEILDGLVDTFVTLCPLANIMYSDGRLVNGDKEWALTTGLFDDFPIRTFIERAKVLLSTRDGVDAEIVLATLCGTMKYCNYPVKQGMKEILNSNFTKYPTTSMLKDMYGDDLEVALEAAADDAETKFGYNDVVGTIVDGHCVFRTEGGLGKIAKNWNYRKPNLAQFFHPDELKV